jgi:hypothetical protein
MSERGYPNPRFACLDTGRKCFQREREGRLLERWPGPVGFNDGKHGTIVFFYKRGFAWRENKKVWPGKGLLSLYKRECLRFAVDFGRNDAYNSYPFR